MGSVLLLMIMLPASGAVIALLLSASPQAVRWVSLGITLVTLVLALVVVGNFEPSDPAVLASEVMSPQMTLHMPWFSFNLPAGGQGGIEAFLGIDGISLWLVALTTLLMVSAV